MDHREPWRGRPVAVSDHATLRWLERVHGVPIDPLRRFLSALTGAGRPNDRLVARLIERAHGTSLDPVRLMVRRALDEGETLERHGHFDVLLPSGHSVVVPRSRSDVWNVATVLPPELSPRPPGDPPRTRKGPPS